MKPNRVVRIAQAHPWLARKDICLMLHQAYDTFSEDCKGEEIQINMEKWTSNLCKLSEYEARNLLSLAKELSIEGIEYSQYP